MEIEYIGDHHVSHANTGTQTSNIMKYV